MLGQIALTLHLIHSSSQGFCFKIFCRRIAEINHLFNSRLVSDLSRIAPLFSWICKRLRWNRRIYSSPAIVCESKNALAIQLVQRMHCFHDLFLGRSEYRQEMNNTEVGGDIRRVYITFIPDIKQQIKQSSDFMFFSEECRIIKLFRKHKQCFILVPYQN